MRDLFLTTYAASLAIVKHFFSVWENDKFRKLSQKRIVSDEECLSDNHVKGGDEAIRSDVSPAPLLIGFSHEETADIQAAKLASLETALILAPRAINPAPTDTKTDAEHSTITFSSPASSTTNSRLNASSSRSNSTISSAISTT